MGFGTENVLCWGGAVFKVNTLSDSSTVAADPNFTTLREAPQAPGACSVIFEVSGTITLTQLILIRCVVPHGWPLDRAVSGHPGERIFHRISSRTTRSSSTWPCGPGSDNPLPRNCVDRVNLNNRTCSALFTVKNELTPDTYKVVLDHVSGSWTTMDRFVYGDHAICIR